jgi:hypothetical protein
MNTTSEEGTNSAPFNDHCNITNLESQLSEFLNRNPESCVAVNDGILVIEKPWGDSSILFRVLEEDSELIDALNSVRFPPLFSALWHADSKDLEFIYPSPNRNDDTNARTFSFQAGEQSFTCEFANASPRLRVILDRFQPATKAPTRTRYRNLNAYPLALIARKIREQREALTPEEREDVHNLTEELEPYRVSFWIRDIDIEKVDVEVLTRSLNFYMRLFDRESPVIDIFDSTELPATLPRSRYPYGDFPSTIVSKRLDNYMVQVWQTADNRHPLTMFLYSYQILEYASFYYVPEELVDEIRRVISSPSMPGRSEEVARSLLELVVDMRLGDEQKIVKVVEKYVDVEMAWSVIETYFDSFAQECRFDGGFLVPPLVRKEWQLADFKSAWIPKLPDALRRIRNGLVHAREARANNSIAPTAHNYRKLYPWAALIHEVAAQVIVTRE